MSECLPNVIYASSFPEGGITTITLNRRTKRNAVDSLTAVQLHSAFLRFGKDISQHVAILTGSNGTFCAGADRSAAASTHIGDMLKSPDIQPMPLPASSKITLKDHDDIVQPNIAPMGPSRLGTGKPVIAAISGYAIAGGLELASLCDLHIVEEDAVPGVFCRRFGVPLIDGGTVRLPAIVGLGRAVDFVLTGRELLADEAERMGLVTRVVARGQAYKKAAELAKSLMSFPQACMNADRESVSRSAYEATGFAEKVAGKFESGLKILGEGLEGAKKFRDGQGRGGSKLNTVSICNE